MESVQPSPQQPTSPVSSNRSGSFVMPNQLQELSGNMASLTKLLVEVSQMLISLRREFRGEGLYQSEDGGDEWIQVSRPIFVKMNLRENKPLMEEKNMPWGEKKMCYIPHDEAIDEVLSMLKFAGVNQINPIGFNTPENYQDDLKYFEYKLAAVLALKQQEWGIDKELLPMAQYKISTIIQDVRSMSLNGNVLKALQTTISRVEQMIEGERGQKKIFSSPYS